MTITRRHFTLAATACAGAGFLPRRVLAQASMHLGERRVDLVSDGFLELPRDIALGPAPSAAAEAILARHGIGPGPLTPPCNLTLMREPGRAVLFDIGAGPDFMPSAGRLPETLDALGLTPEEITHLVLTHGHPDHLWGLLDDFGDPFLPEAEICMGRAEYAYWSDPATADTIGPARQSFAAGARWRLEAVADRIRLFDDGEEVLPGVTARETPGHTPGHMSFLLEDAGARLFVTGDAIGNDHIAFEAPEQPSGSDQDAVLGAATRVALLAELAADETPVAGFHLRGGLGRVMREGAAYRFVPAA